MTDAKNVDTGGMGRRISEVGDLLDTMTIIDPAATVDFVGRLAAENRWTRDHAEQVYGEYLRFLLMAWMSPTMVVPSHDVDQAWHLHLTHTRHYWNVLCGTILLKPLHHDPSLGTGTDAGRHFDHYRSTLSLYRYLFDEEPPLAVWPGARRVGRREGQKAVLASGASATGTAVCAALGFMGLMNGHAILGTVALTAAVLLLLVTIAGSVVAEDERRRQAPATRTARRTYGSQGAARTGSSRSDTSGSDGALAFTAWTDPTATTAHGHSHGHSHGATDGGHSDGGHGGHSCGGHSCGSSCGGGGCGGGGD